MVQANATRVYRSDALASPLGTTCTGIILRKVESTSHQFVDEYVHDEDGDKSRRNDRARNPPALLAFGS